MDAPEDPVAFLENLMENPQANERRPLWAATDAYDLKLSTSSAETGGWSGKMPAYLSSPHSPGGPTILDSRSRKVVAFPDETASRVQARLQRLAAELERPAVEPERPAAAPVDAEQAPSEPRQVADLQVEVSATSVAAQIGAADEWEAELAAVASEVVDAAITLIVDSVPEPEAAEPVPEAATEAEQDVAADVIQAALAVVIQAAEPVPEAATEAERVPAESHTKKAREVVAAEEPTVVAAAVETTGTAPTRPDEGPAQKEVETLTGVDGAGVPPAEQEQEAQELAAEG